MDLKKHLLQIPNKGYYGFSRRKDSFVDDDENRYEGVVYILALIWTGDEDNHDDVVEEIEDGYDMGTDLEFPFIEFTYSQKDETLIDSETEEALNLEFMEPEEDQTYLFYGSGDHEGFKEVFARDVDEYGEALAEQFDPENIEKKIFKMKEKFDKSIESQG